MSGRGIRPTGTDGSDFRHRQRIATHFQQSLTNKFRLKLTFMVHAVLYFLLFLKLFEDILDRFDIDWLPLERLKVPEPRVWEYVWMCTIVPVILGLLSLQKNKDKLMLYCYYGIFGVGLLPLAFGAGSGLPALWRFSAATYDSAEVTTEANANSDELESEKFLGLPVIVLWYMFFTAAIQVHLVQLYLSAQLVTAWAPKGPVAASDGPSVSESDKTK